MRAAVSDIALQGHDERAAFIDVIGRTLELVARPAFLLDDAGQVAFVNAAGRTLVARDRSIAEEVAVATLAGVSPPPCPRVVSVTPIGAEGGRRYFIVIARGREDASHPRLQAVVERHHLTGTQARVLQLLVRGEANKDIAMQLQCASRTVELHVTAILRKCSAESRARLIAWFWTHP